MGNMPILPKYRVNKEKELVLLVNLIFFGYVDGAEK